MHRAWLTRLVLGQALLGLLLVLAFRLLAVAADDDLQTEEQIESARAKLYDVLNREVAALERQSNALKLVVKLVRPTVVHIEAETTEASSVRYNRRSLVEEAGSGFLVKINERPFVITNRHVVNAADLKKIKIRLADGRLLYPTRKWDDESTDIAVLAVNAPGLMPSRIGDSELVEIGDFVLAVGSPFGLSHSMTFGIVSATNRRDLQLGEAVKFKDFIQTDAAINPGNSGGPLINLRGEVIGMNTAIASSSGGSEGIGFSIPVNVVMHIARQLVQNNAVARAYLGVQLDASFDPAMAVSVGLSRPRGARVKEINAGSPAAAAKLQKGDVILEYNGVKVDNDSHLIDLVFLTDIGRELPLSILRDGKPMNLLVTITSAPTERAATPTRPGTPGRIDPSQGVNRPR